jgi:zinc protease
MRRLTRIERALHRLTIGLFMLSTVSLGLACAGKGAGPAAPAGAHESSTGQGALAPQATASGAPATSEPPLPVDPAVRLRTLPNGLRYYLRAHKEPQKRASLRLAVNAGSVLEGEDQQGFAHFVEHMAFNGTRLFKKQELVDYIEKVGMRFGQHANASTSFDETIYTFDVPTDKEGVLAKGLTILQQIASEVSFDPAEVDRERGVVIEEWRLGRGAATRVMEQIMPVVFKGSRYAERLPIGKKEILEKATAEGLKAFYKKWYRPDLMAVMAVGDFDVDKLEAQIQALFGALPAPPPGQAGARPVFPVPDHQETLVVTAKDKELPSTTVGVVYKLPRRSTLSRKDYRRLVVESIYHGMINGRLEELTRVPDPPFLFAGSATQPFVRSKDVFLQIAATKQEGVGRGLEALTREVERVDRHGFTKGELDREKNDRLRQLERAVLEKDKIPSAGYADEMVRHFLRDEAMPGVARELELHKEFLPTITLAEMNRVASEWITERNRVILVQAPEAAPVPPAAELRQVFERVQAETVDAFVDKVAAGPLVDKLPPPGKITRERQISELAVTEWQLGNGVRVVWKATDFKNDEILMTAFSPGGHSRISDRDFESALYAADVVSSSGVGKLGPTELRKALSGKVVGVGPFINELEEGLSGSASPADLETMMQLVHLYVTAPRKDPEVFAAFKAQMVEQLQRRSAEPQTVFWDKWQVTYYGNHPRRRPPSIERASRVTLEGAHRVYRDRFADAGDFTFVLVGRLDPAKLRPLVEQYLATLPSKRRKETWRDVGARFKGEGKAVEHRGGVEPKATVVVTFVRPARWTREEEHRLDSLTEALSIRLREVLREDLGGTYGVRVSADLSRRPVQRGRTDVNFSCSPENATKLTDAVYTEIRSAKQKSVGPDYIDKVKAAQRRSLEEAVRTNGYWLGHLGEHYRYGTDPRLVLEEPKLIERLDAAGLQAAAVQYFDEKRQMKGVLLPAVSAPLKPGETAPTPKASAPRGRDRTAGHTIVAPAAL